MTAKPSGLCTYQPCPVCGEDATELLTDLPANLRLSCKKCKKTYLVNRLAFMVAKDQMSQHKVHHAFDSIADAILHGSSPSKR